MNLLSNLTFTQVILISIAVAIGGALIIQLIACCINKISDIKFKRWIKRQDKGEKE